jgi:hypothetical protein
MPELAARSPEPNPRDVSCTLRVCGRKKLPFAGYSVVKELVGFWLWARGFPPDADDKLHLL